jgi:hypothetical protein
LLAVIATSSFLYANHVGEDRLTAQSFVLILEEKNHSKKHKKDCSLPSKEKKKIDRNNEGLDSKFRCLQSKFCLV